MMNCSNQLSGNDQRVVCKNVYHKLNIMQGTESESWPSKKKISYRKRRDSQTRRKRWYENNKERLARQPESLLSTEQGVHQNLPNSMLCFVYNNLITLLWGIPSYSPSSHWFLTMWYSVPLSHVLIRCLPCDIVYCFVNTHFKSNGLERIHFTCANAQHTSPL